MNGGRKVSTYLQIFRDRLGHPSIGMQPDDHAPSLRWVCNLVKRGNRWVDARLWAVREHQLDGMMRRPAIELHMAYARDLVQRQPRMLGFGIDDGLGIGGGSVRLSCLGILWWNWGNNEAMPACETDLPWRKANLGDADLLCTLFGTHPEGHDRPKFRPLTRSHRFIPCCPRWHIYSQSMWNSLCSTFEHTFSQSNSVNAIARSRHVEATWYRMFFSLFRFQRGRDKGKTIALRHRLVKARRREAISFTFLR